MASEHRLIYFGRPPFVLYIDDYPRTEHNYGTAFVKRMYDLKVRHIMPQRFPRTQQAIPGNSFFASDEQHIFYFKGAAIMYELMPGRQIKVEVTFEHDNPNMKELEALLLAQEDLLPPRYNEQLHPLPKRH